MSAHPGVVPWGPHCPWSQGEAPLGMCQRATLLVLSGPRSTVHSSWCRRARTSSGRPHLSAASLASPQKSFRFPWGMHRRRADAGPWRHLLPCSSLGQAETLPSPLHLRSSLGLPSPWGPMALESDGWGIATVTERGHPGSEGLTYTALWASVFKHLSSGLDHIPSGHPDSCPPSKGTEPTSSALLSAGLTWIGLFI